jgi:integrase
LVGVAPSFLIEGLLQSVRFTGLKKPWAALARAVRPTGFRVHDLRHSFASLAAGASLGLPVFARLLGHTQPATMHRYAHLDADPLRRASESIGATISAAMEGKRGAEVAPLKPRGGACL